MIYNITCNSIKAVLKILIWTYKMFMWLWGREVLKHFVIIHCHISHGDVGWGGGLIGIHFEFLF
jgi:hypothetical protein